VYAVSNLRGPRALLGLSLAIFLAVGQLSAQSASNNPYHATYGWGELPDGREMGILSGAFPDPDGRHMWILERCSANECAGTDLDPIHKIDLETGRAVESFGGGLFAWPHGFFLDHEGYFWVTEGSPHGDARGERGEALGMGHQVHKLTPDGEIVMSLGQAGVHGDGRNHFNGPAGVVVTSNGNI